MGCETLTASEIGPFLEKLAALEASIRELRKPFSFDPSKRQCLNEGMIDAAFTNMLRNITPIKTNARALESLLTLRECAGREADIRRDNRE